MTHFIPGRPGHFLLEAERLLIPVSAAAVVRIILLFFAIYGITVALPPVGPADMKRFIHSGDGIIHLKSKKNGKVFKGLYRDENQRYKEDAYMAISAVFGAPYQAHERNLSLRLIEFLDLLSDQMGEGAMLTIISGYRAPDYNTGLRKGGALAAKASLHQYGMAADFIMDGVSSSRIWNHVKALGFGGTGYYHGKTVHVDVGPSRSWDEKSSGVGTGLSDDNKLIGLVTDFDRYAPGDWITMRFIRMTAFPIKVRAEFTMLNSDDRTSGQESMTLIPDSAMGVGDKCRTLSDIRQMGSLRWRLPGDVSTGRYHIRATFCDNEWESMPKEVATPGFEVRSSPLTLW